MEILQGSLCSSELAPGHLLESTGLRFKPDESHGSLLSLNAGLINVTAFMCLGCGPTEMKGDLNKFHQDLRR